MRTQKDFARLFLILICAWALPIAHSQPHAQSQPRALPLMQAADFANIDPALRTTILENFGNPAPLLAMPDFAQKFPKMVQVLQSILVPGDGSDPVYFMVSEDMRISTAYIQSDVPGGGRVIVINLGLLQRILSDDQLAFVMGAELERGATTNKDFSEREKYFHDNPLDESVRMHMFEKSSEGSVAEVKALDARVHAHGYNANEALAFINHLRSTIALDEQRASALNTRASLVEGTLTAISRGRGQSTSAVPVRHEAISDLHLHDPTFLAERRRRALEIINEPISTLEPMLEKLKHLMGPAPDKDNLARLYHFAADEERRRLARLKFELQSLVSDEELREWRQRLDVRLLEMNREISDRVLGHDFVASNPYQLELYTEYQRFLTFLSTFSHMAESALVETLKRQNDLDAEAAKIRSKGGDATAREKSRLEQIARERPVLTRKIEIERSEFTDPARAMELAHKHLQIAAQTTNAHPDNDTLLELSSLQRHLGDESKRGVEIARKAFERNLPLVAQAAQIDGGLSGLTGYLEVLPDAESGTNDLRLIREFNAQFAFDLSRITESAARAAYMKKSIVFWHDLLLHMSMFNESEKRSADAHSPYYAELKKYVHAFVEAAPDSPTLNLVGENKIEDLRYPAWFDEDDGISWNQEGHDLFFDDGLRARTAARRTELIASALRTHPAKEALEQADRYVEDLGHAEGAHRAEQKARVVAVVREKLIGELALSPSAADTFLAARFAEPESGDARKAFAHFLATSPERTRLAGLVPYDVMLATASANGRLDAALVVQNSALIGPSSHHEITSHADFENQHYARREVLDWAIVHEPEKFAHLLELATEKFSMAAKFQEHQRTFADRTGEALLADLLRSIDRQIPATTPDRYRIIFERFLRLAGTSFQINHWMHNAVARVYPGLETSARAFIGYTRARQAITPNMSQMDLMNDLHTQAMGFDLREPENFSNLSLDTRIDVVALLGELDRTTDAIDFQVVWDEVRHKRPDLIPRLLDPKFVELIHHHDTQREFSKWQLEQKFGIAKAADDLLNRKVKPAAPNAVRPVVAEIKAFVDLQFSKPTAFKDNVLDYLERELLTSAAETELLKQSRFDPHSSVEKTDLLALELPHAFASKVKSNHDRLEFIRFFAGSGPLPEALREMPDDMIKHLAVSKAYEFKEKYARAHPAARALAIKSLIDPIVPENPADVREPDVYEGVVRLILGRNADNEVVRELMQSYLQAAPAEQKKVLLAHVVSQLKGNGDSGVPLKNILEAMGPFGIKAGQFLRTSGMISRELAQELDGFLDGALKPAREKIHADLKRILGDHLKSLDVTWELAGSGSINYVVVLDLVDPDGKVSRVAFRIKREHVEGQIAEENRIWTDAIALMMDPAKSTEVRNAARIANEARLHSQETLKAGGRELSPAFERRMQGVAERVYGGERNSKTGFRTRAVQINQYWQTRLERELDGTMKPDTFSVYEYVAHTQLKKIYDPQTRAELAEQIVEAELRALFNSDHFDPDGHVGNWLIDVDNRELVRIDVAQMTEFPPADQAAFRTIVELLSDDHPLGSTRKLAETFLALTHGVTVSEAELTQGLAKILKEADYQRLKLPHEKLFYLQDRVQKMLNHDHAVDLRPITRAALSSMGRLQMYDEFLPAGRLRALIGKHIGLRAWQVWKPQVRRALGHSAAELCRKFLTM